MEHDTGMTKIEIKLLWGPSGAIFNQATTIEHERMIAAKRIAKLKATIGERAKEAE